MHIVENVRLTPYNTFGLDARAAHYAEASSIAELQTLLRAGIQPIRILGGGSNVLLLEDLPGLTIRNTLRGIEITRRFKNQVWVKAGAGENWHGLVLWALDKNLGGLENLSLIPGTVGAAPVQNIGAYGVELKDCFVSLEAVELKTGKIRHFSKKDCRFGYRDSVFKGVLKGRYCIASVTLSLTTANHRLHLEYGDIRRQLEASGIQNPEIADISQAVIRIRSSKLPDPAVIGNAGSFFKNPELAAGVLDRILQTYHNAPHFPLPDGRVKIPAGWLIEQCGWKGKRVGNTGCYEKQALVLVNHGNAKGAEVWALARAIIESVQERFAVTLEPEVNPWP